MVKRFALLLGILCSLEPMQAEVPQLLLGPKPSFGLFQPRVTVDISDGISGRSLGPEASTFLLDTAANGLVIFPPATEQLAASGFQNEGTYEEAGISGTSVFEVSSPYDLAFAGTDGIPQHLSGVRFMSSPTAVDPTGLMGLNGIVGMAGMVGKVTTIDNRTREGAPSLGMGLTFSDAVPATSTHRFTVPFGQIDFPVEGDPPSPTWSESLPSVELNASNGEYTVNTPIVFDTGAQQTIISQALAHALGLDANGNGDFADEATVTVPISGATGSINAPVLLVERMSLPTDQGFELVWSDAEVIVLDIDPRISGVIGADFITDDGGLDFSFLQGGGLGDLGDLLGGGGLGDLGDLLGGGGLGDLGDLLGGGGLGDLGDLLGGGGLGDLGDLLGGGGLGDLLGGGLGDLLGGDLGGLLGGDLGGLLGGSDLFAAFPLDSNFDRVHLDFRNYPEGGGKLILDVKPEISTSILNGDHVFDVRDIDDLTLAIGSADRAFDLDGDGDVGFDDRDDLIREVLGILPGDANLDRNVDFADFLVVADAFGENGGWGRGDFNGDGLVQFADFLLLAQHFGQTTGDVRAVPEPTSSVLSVIALLSVYWLSRRRQHAC